MSRVKSKGKGKPLPPRKEVNIASLHQALERAKPALSPTDYENLVAAVDTLGFLTSELEHKQVTLERLRRYLFGPSTEKTDKVVKEPEAGEGDKPPRDTPADQEATEAPADQEATETPAPKPKAPGHGRNGASDYTGAKHVKVAHPTLKHGDGCPACQAGHVYEMTTPSVMVRLQGMPLVSGTVYEKERMRCNTCNKVFVAPPPEGVGEEKYDATAVAMVATARYGLGFTFSRVEKLQGEAGIPLPASTQWDLARSARDKTQPVHEELIRQAAQADLFHNDDTGMKVLSLGDDEKEFEENEKVPEGRTGVQTTAIVAVKGDKKMALFFTGRRHAGENLGELLQDRIAKLPPPMQMCDGLSRNTRGNLSGSFTTILGNCLAHARRNYVDLVDKFPDACTRVLEDLREVYANDDEARKQKLSDDDRLRYHQEHSKKIMDGLHAWIMECLDGDEEKGVAPTVEPNSTLGEAMTYMRTRWEPLTLFLRKAGAPLDNNLCYAARGITQVMPRPGLCRDGGGCQGAAGGDHARQIVADAA